MAASLCLSKRRERTDTMGTNYYAHVNPCSECGKPEEKLHLGKSSGGWKFCFRDRDEYSDITEFQTFIRLDYVKLVDEYGREISPDDFMEKVEGKQDERSHIESVDKTEDWRSVEGYEFFDREFS